MEKKITRFIVMLIIISILISSCSYSDYKSKKEKTANLEYSLDSMSNVTESIQNTSMPLTEYYEDGSIKWSGKYHNGKYEYSEVDSCKCWYEFSNHDIKSPLRLDSIYKIRVSTDCLHPDDIGYACLGCKILLPADANGYLTLMPMKIRPIELLIYRAGQTLQSEPKCSIKLPAPIK